MSLEPYIIVRRKKRLLLQEKEYVCIGLEMGPKIDFKILSEKHLFKRKKKKEKEIMLIVSIKTLEIERTHQ